MVVERGIPAVFWKPSSDKRVTCELCPHYCIIAPGHCGRCSLRYNDDGELYASGYGKIAAIAIDPIEKKPLYHFKPGTPILSVGPNGCNMTCRGCQNYPISQYPVDTDYISPEGLIAICKDKKSPGIAYTYSEPMVWFEYVRDVAALARDNGIYNVIVSNGFINPVPLAEIAPYIDAANIDIKSFRPAFYRDYCGAALEPVLETCEYLKKRIHLEITNLIIPNFNDTKEEIEELVSWVASQLGRDTPIHFSAYYPTYKMTEAATPPHRVLFAKELAERELYYVYIGNVRGMEGSDTICPECGNLLLERDGYRISIKGIDGTRCRECGREIEVVF